MFDKILIANRGEIAIRIAATCRRLGVRTLAVYSEIDARSQHVQAADEAVCIGPARSDQSYLARERIIEVALAHGCAAIHPGYGFLSENPAFAEMVASAGLNFIGPPAAAIAALGDKVASKALAVKAGVPVVPGVLKSVDDLEEALAGAEGIGYPLLLKPAAGGGGKGMRIVASRDELAAAMQAGRAETRKAFGDDRVFVEKYIPVARHVEIQIMADRHGAVIHLGERECSVQRRYQKVVEESPSVAVGADLRRQMGGCACRLAWEAGYVNAGTVEFILDPAGSFYFLEMNTRLQVEHPVTEMVTGLDLVELQLRVAAGEHLPLRQEDVSWKGWAVEARVCAEDPGRGFLPSTGMITRYSPARGANIRLDSGVEAGSLISVFYDSLLAKVIAWGETRQHAIDSLVRALNGYHIEGLATNVDFVNSVLTHPEFVAGNLSTAFIETHFDKGLPKVAPPVERLHFMAMAATIVYHNRQNLTRESLKPMAAQVGVAHAPLDCNPYMVRCRQDVFEVCLRKDPPAHEWTVTVDGLTYTVTTPEFEFYRRRLNLKINGRSHMFRLYYQYSFFGVAFCGTARVFEVFSPREWELSRHMPAPRDDVLENVLLCPMPGLVVEVRVRKGDRVYRGQDLVSIESMKMESFVASPCDGEVAEVLAVPGQAVESDEVLVRFRA
ncbi:MAG: acetyl-CoA carboxylase biotin carboxylase subunit [Desulfobacterales bacterium]|nr:acetyl-CoA carboxylase biotin carboxylase subunit [Desulfobacterales bacterium]